MSDFSAVPPSNSQASSQSSLDISLTQRAEQFDLLVERATDFAIFLLDPAGNVATWNEGARRILGYEDAEVLGQSGQRFYTPEDQAQGIHERQLRIARAEGRAANERWQMRKDGSRFYASGIDQVLTDATGEVRGYSLIFRDETKQKQMQEALQASEERYRRIVDGITQYAIFTLDSEGMISDWNAGAEHVLGYRAEEIVGQPLALLYAPEDVAAGLVQKELQQVMRHESIAEERWHVRKGGVRFWGSCVLMLMNDGAPRRFLKVMRDMTQSKHAEEERVRHQAYVAVLQERNRMAQELHDTLAQGFMGIKMQMDAAEMALRGQKEVTEEERIEEEAGEAVPQAALSHILRAREIALQSLMEARSSIRGLRAPLLEGSSLAVAMQHLTEQTIDSIKVRFVLEGTQQALSTGIENDLYRIAQEAVTNALRHAQAASILVELTYTPAQVCLHVTDDGQGFDREAGRAGFGLMGMQERAQRLGAQWTLTSKPGQGTEILLTLPRTENSD